MSDAPMRAFPQPAPGSLLLSISFCLFLGFASSFKDVGQSVIRFMACVLVKSVGGIRFERHVHRPGTRPCSGVLDGRVIAQLVGSRSREAFDDMKGFGEQGKSDAVHA